MSSAAGVRQSMVSVGRVMRRAISSSSCWVCWERSFDLSPQVVLPAEGVGTHPLQRPRGRTRVDLDRRRLPDGPERRRARVPRCHRCSPAGHAPRVRAVRNRTPDRPLHGPCGGAPRARRSPPRARRPLAAAHRRCVLAPPGGALRRHPPAPPSRRLRVVDDHRRRDLVALCLCEPSRQPVTRRKGRRHRSRKSGLAAPDAGSSARAPLASG